jgi:hypothetical protein
MLSGQPAEEARAALRPRIIVDAVLDKRPQRDARRRSTGFACFDCVFGQSAAKGARVRSQLSASCSPPPDATRNQTGRRYKSRLVTCILTIACAAVNKILVRCIPSVRAGAIKLEPNPTKVLFRKRHSLFMLKMASVRL